MRILTHLPQLEALGGVETVLLDITRRLAARGHQVQLAYEHDGNLSDDFRGCCEGLTRIPSPRYSDSPLADARHILPAVRATRRPRPDLIYVHNFSELLWASGVRTLTHAPIVCHLHELAPFRRASLSVLGRPVASFVVASEFSRSAWAERGLRANRIDVIPNGIDVDDYPRASAEDRMRARRTLGLPDAAYVVVYVGRVAPGKGVEDLLDAWRLLEAPPESSRLLIVGVTPGQERRDDHLRALQARTPPGCEWLPMRRDVVSILHAADVLVLASRCDEAFGRVIVEAMCTGLPAIGAAVGGIPEILDGEFSSLLVPRADAQVLAERLRELSSWRRDQPDLGERCAARVLDRYTLDLMVDRLEAGFLRVSGTGSQRSGDAPMSGQSSVSSSLPSAS